MLLQRFGGGPPGAGGAATRAVQALQAAQRARQNQPGDVFLNIYDERNDPLKGARGWLIVKGIKGEGKSDTSTNMITFSGVPPGSHTAIVEMKRYKTYRGIIHVKRGLPTSVDIKLEMNKRGALLKELTTGKEGINKLRVSEKEKKKMLKDLKKDIKKKLEGIRDEEKKERGEFVKTQEMKDAEKREKFYQDRGVYNKAMLNSKKFFEDRVGARFTSVFGILITIIPGMVISQFFEGSWSGYFTLGFILLAISTLFKEPLSFEGLGGEKFIMSFKSMLSFNYMVRKGRGFSTLKSLLKFGAIYFFIMGAMNATAIWFLQNIVMLVVSALSYFSLKSEFDPRVPGQVIEGVARLFLGMIILPWMVFYGIFQSFVLGLIAMAFFMVPPVPLKERETESTIRGEYTRYLFAIIMLAALIGSGVFGDTSYFPTWELTGALKSTFLYFWIVTAIAGFFAPPQQRPAIGFIMITAAVFIYAAGPGTQQFGSAILGPWFGQAWVGFADLMAPVNEAFNSIGATFGNAFQMIINPVGFAQGIMIGNYQNDPETGLTGALGLEVGNFRSTPIYIDQEYNIIVPIQNKGSAVASNVKMTLLAGTGVGIGNNGLKVKDIPKSEVKWYKPVDLQKVGINNDYSMDFPSIFTEKTEINLELLGFADNKLEGISCKDKICSASIKRKMPKLDSEQVFFVSGGIPCSSIVEYGLLTEKTSKFLPFSVLLEYDYSVESTLQIEAISNEEWQRLAQEGTLYPSQKKPSTMKNSPVMLNLDTLEQPIREGTRFYIALNLTPAIPAKSKVTKAKVSLKIPRRLLDNGNLDHCTSPPADPIYDEDSATLVWNKRSANDRNNQPGTYPVNTHAIYCYFNKMILDENSPTQTYFIRANSEYSLMDVTTKPFAILFGGQRCCKTKDDCPGESPVCGSGGKPNTCGGSATVQNECKANGGYCDPIETDLNTDNCGGDANRKQQYDSACPSGQVCCIDTASSSGEQSSETKATTSSSSTT